MSRVCNDAIARVFHRLCNDAIARVFHRFAILTKIKLKSRSNEYISHPYYIILHTLEVSM